MVEILFFERFKMWSPRGRAPAAILTEKEQGGKESGKTRANFVANRI